MMNKTFKEILEERTQTLFEEIANSEDQSNYPIRKLVEEIIRLYTPNLKNSLVTSFEGAMKEGVSTLSYLARNLVKPEVRSLAIKYDFKPQIVEMLGDLAILNTSNPKLSNDETLNFIISDIYSSKNNEIGISKMEQVCEAAIAGNDPKHALTYFK